ncbi:hypothetical protein AAFF_G00441640 [Aldrovandia affinis]|uniref:Uncharacterized protein n=1 Tax=Aldrovandia affinis TaxID=143900 RepID=A0AAD7S7C8_9TELE|nr:hypothetical protein AAFF_G00441640 [Aldrovandia affinis]
MPPPVLSEYARDQFVRAIEPRDLRERVQLRHPSTLQEALELALEREELRAPRRCGSFPRAHALLGVWPGGHRLRDCRDRPEKQGTAGVRLGGAERTPGAMSHADLSPAEGANGTAGGVGLYSPQEQAMALSRLWWWAGRMQAIFAMSPSPWLGAVFGPGGHGFDCGR